MLKRITLSGLLSCGLIMQGCATQIPVGGSCPPFPQPSEALMQKPAITNFSEYYNTLKSKP